MLLALLGSCSTFSPEPLAIPLELHDVQAKSSGDVTVSVAILSDEQARSHFDADLKSHDLQALWMRVDNASPNTYWLLRNCIDPDLYPPDEAARAVHEASSDEQFKRLVQYFRDEAMHVMLPPRTVTDGFIFLPRREGGRYVDVRLARDTFELDLARAQLRAQQAPEHGEAERALDASVLLRLGFAVPLPDGIFDYERLDSEHTYAGMELPNLDTGGLREQLEQIQPCATNGAGDRNADPLNVLLVGESTDVLNSLSRCGWSFTHRITWASARRLIGATIGGNSYPVAPVSDLYLFGRNQDIALQRARASISQRSHMRLWLAPFRCEGKQVWIGQVSRDIGIKLTTESPTLTTHIIDPEVDLAREYLLHGLLAEGFVERFGFALGSRAATRMEPALNLTSDPYFGDGLRLVVFLAPQPVPYDQVRSLLWEHASDPQAEGQTDHGRRRFTPID